MSRSAKRGKVTDETPNCQCPRYNIYKSRGVCGVYSYDIKLSEVARCIKVFPLDSFSSSESFSKRAGKRTTFNLATPRVGCARKIHSYRNIYP